VIIYLHWIYKIESSSSTLSSGLYMNVYICAFMIGLGCAIHRHNCETISIFSFSLSPSLITCVHHIVDRRKKKVDLGLLLIFFFFFFFSFFSLRVAWHNTRPIKWNKSSEASKEREKRERERNRKRKSSHF